MLSPERWRRAKHLCWFIGSVPVISSEPCLPGLPTAGMEAGQAAASYFGGTQTAVEGNLQVTDSTWMGSV